MGCTPCLEQSLRDAQRALTRERAYSTMLRLLIQDLRHLLPPEYQARVDEALQAKFM